jgi:hypothetical protein
MLTPTDLTQLQSKGITEEQVNQQIENFQQGFPYMKLQRAARVGDGIVKLQSEEVDGFSDYYRNHLNGNRVVKFVPASGAASRMFKDFFGLMQQPDKKEEYQNAQAALTRIRDFAFYDELKSKLAGEGFDLGQELQDHNYSLVLEYILTEKGLNYGYLPKGLLAFHRYNANCRVPMEEHLVEAARYGRNDDGTASLHFTVSPQHRQLFGKLEQSVKSRYEQELSVTYTIVYSEQKPSTDTIAVDLDNQPFREDDGTLLFRPGGHGALLENLNETDGDLVFVKNIDNVVPDHLKEETYRYKAALGGLLLQVREEAFSLLNRLDEGDEMAITAAAAYLKDTLNVQPPAGRRIDQEYLREKLNRPIRVCGMVKNEGEPGGGPFWALSDDGTTSLQIVEASQVDPDDDSQQEIVQKATHFNPVDLVCSTRDYQGNKFDLIKYRDPKPALSAKNQKMAES